MSLCVPQTPLLHPAERHLFMEQFQRDEQFFRLLLSWINASCPVPNVDLVWTEASAEATRTTPDRWSQRFDLERPALHPFFEGLEPSPDAPPGGACTEVPGIQRAKDGLAYIAVPVVAGGHHIATLMTGKVLTAPPTGTQAHRNAPVVKDADLRHAAETLQVVAGFLSKVFAQTMEAAKEQRRKSREVRLARQEFVYLALDWSESEGGKISAEEITAYQRRIGFHRSPNRILVVRPEADRGSRGRYPVSPLEAVEKMCDKLDGVQATRVEASSICVFLYDGGPGANSSQKVESRRLAARILHEIREQCDLSTRIGIGRPKEDWRGLAESYREACAALSASGQPIAFYQEPCGSADDLSRRVEDLCRSLRENRIEEVALAVAALPEQVSRRLGARSEDFAFARLFFSFVMDSMSLAAQKLGLSGPDLGALCAAAAAEFKRAPSFIQLEATWLRCAGELLERARRLNSGKRRKIVESACRTIESGIERGSGAHELLLSTVAAGLRVSVSHLSRTFKQETGQTFEQYVITKRIDFSKRLLRDPLYNISEVAVRSGFSDPSYFARAFRKVVGCSPRAYSANPQDIGSSALRDAAGGQWSKASHAELPDTPLYAPLNIKSA